MNSITSSASGPISRRGFLRDSARLTGALALATMRRGQAAEPAAGAPTAPATETWQIGCYTRPWDAHELKVALDGIAEAGYRYAGILTAKGKSWVIVTPEMSPEEASKIGDEARQRGLKVISVYGGDFPLTSVEAGVAGLRRLIESCAAIGSPNLLLGGTGDAALFERYYRIIAEACPHAAERKIGLSIKPHGGLNATSAQCRKAIERVGQPNFRLWYDPGNIFYYSDGRLDPVDDAPQAAGLVAGMSVKDFQPPKEVLVTPGTGRVRFREVLDRLRGGGFTRGPLVVECLEKGEVRAITEAARRTRRFLEELVAS